MRELYTEDLNNGRSEEAQKGAPAIRKHRINKRKFLISLVFFAALVALGVVGMQSFFILKMLYLALIDITKKWTGRRQDWGQIHAQLKIFFEDR